MLILACATRTIRFWPFQQAQVHFSKVSRMFQNFKKLQQKAAPNSVITGSAQFRSRKRLPVLTYLHSNAAAIVRCAQPMAGANNRSDDDEMYFNYLVETSRSKSNGLIVDTRPMLNAMANRWLYFQKMFNKLNLLIKRTRKRIRKYWALYQVSIPISRHWKHSRDAQESREAWERRLAKGGLVESCLCRFGCFKQSQTGNSRGQNGDCPLFRWLGSNQSSVFR